MKIIAIVGSLRKESYNKKLALLMQEKLTEMDMEIVTLEDIPLFNEDVEYPAPSSVKLLRDKIKAADAVWIFSPEYNQSVPGVLKNTLDWLSRPVSEVEEHVLNNKKVILSGTSMGPFGAVNAYNDLVQLMVFLNTNLLTKPRLTIPKAYENVSDENGFITDAVTAIREFLK